MKRNPDFITRNIAGEILLVPTGKAAAVTNSMITLNQTAACILENIDGNSEEEIVNILMEKFDVDKNSALEDVRGFLSELKQFSIVLEE